MKKLLIGLMLCGLSTAAFAQQAPSLVTVDVNKALAGYQRLQEAQVRFENSVTTAREELAVETEKLQAAANEINELQQQMENPALTEQRIAEIQTKLQERFNAFRDKENDFNQMRQRTERTLAERRNNILSLHLEEVRDVIKQVCREKGATLALNVDGNVVLYSDASFDITNEVLQVLNSAAAAR